MNYYAAQRGRIEGLLRAPQAAAIRPISDDGAHAA